MIIEIKPCINKKMEWSTFGISPSVKIPQYPQERKFQNVIKNEASMIMNAIPFAYLRLYSCPNPANKMERIMAKVGLCFRIVVVAVSGIADPPS